ncbi:hypothetical protein FCM35_KLT04664 [Carex littledalei]|uniref:Uncharacterized protein n=1 Tax=Carex littledalei TaxID=544730 RepID=A0A833R3I7_9POAL|nr:hypothetical protein FCM35_KLT04664 [Carex littledalei]
MYRPGGSQTSSSQSQAQSYSSAPPPLRQDDINAISSQVLGVLQPQLNQFMEEMRRSMKRSSSHQVRNLIFGECKAKTKAAFGYSEANASTHQAASGLDCRRLSATSASLPLPYSLTPLA